MLTIGSKAPVFSLIGLMNGEEKTYGLSDFLGKWLILYFYPKDDTPGCTKEACDFRDALDLFSGMNAVIVGVSKDPMKSHEKFSKKYGLPFVLLSDPEMETCATFEVLKEKSMYGKTYMGVDRATFLIDPQGSLLQIWRGVGVSGHVEEILSTVRTESRK